jgi:glutamine---fructose-6-phosphate transaminase (isomerizing)
MTPDSASSVPGSVPSSVPGSVMLSEMNEQPRVLKQLIDARSEIASRVRSIEPSKPLGIVVIARGSSLNAATYMAYGVETLAGIPVSLARPSVFTRYSARPNYTGWLAIAFSQSGQTPEIITAARAVKSCGASLITITNNAASELAQIADAHVDLECGPELAVPATKTVTAQMICALLIATAWNTPDSAFEQNLLAIPGAVLDVLGNSETAKAIAQHWTNCTMLTVLGRGYGFASAHETALKIREVAGIFAEAWSVTAFRHGPIAGLPSNTPVLITSMTTDLDADTTAVVAELNGRGNPVTVSGPNHHDLGEVINPLIDVVRGQQLAWHFATLRGLNPDSPTGLRKVTMTD